MKKFNEMIQFLQTDIWRIRARTLPGARSFWINQLRIFLLAIRGFDEDKCQLRASALTFYSLLSIVPVVAMAFGIAKGFGFEKRLEEQLLTRFQGQEEVVNRIIEFSQSMLQNTQGGVIAGVGVAILFWTVIKVLGNIEKSFNEIWGIQKGRSFVRKFSDYLSIMLVCPILLIMSSSATVMIAGQIKLLVDKLTFLGPVGSLILFLLKFLPYCVMWLLFTFLYVFIPNTKVKFKSALIGGIIAGTIYQMIQFAYITFQIGVSKFNAIYGSFAALPLFLIWLQVSWLIVLFGAEISFAEQNVDTYEFEPDSLKASRYFKNKIALCITHLCVKKFDKGETPLTTDQIANQLEMPIRLVNQVIFELTEAGILAEVKMEKPEAIGYQPARDIEDLTVEKCLSLIGHKGVEDIPYLESAMTETVNGALEALEAEMKASRHNVALKDLPL